MFMCHCKICSQLFFQAAFLFRKMEKMNGLLIVFDINSYLCHQWTIRLLGLSWFDVWCWDDVVKCETIWSWWGQFIKGGWLMSLWLYGFVSKWVVTHQFLSEFNLYFVISAESCKASGWPWAVSISKCT